MQGTQAVGKVTVRRLLELHHEQWHGLDAAVPLGKHVVVRSRHPCVVLVSLTKHKLAEEHECTTLRVADGHLRVLREVFACTIRLATAPLGVEATHRNREHILLCGAMPAIDDVGAYAEGAGEVGLCGTEQQVEPWVAHLPSVDELPRSASFLPLLLQQAPLCASRRHQDTVFRGHGRLSMGAAWAFTIFERACSQREECAEATDATVASARSCGLAEAQLAKA
mmetsp:Transcript_34425/g.88299  ORF Transcript_34425/g.88299 Transcript_34425/m.88299 type:complete len:224 (-) Transcript_34425:580-1251(-)